LIFIKFSRKYLIKVKIKKFVMLNQNTKTLFSLLGEYVFTPEEKDKIFDQVQALLKQNIDIKYKDEHGQNVLHLAASKADVRIIEALIAAGADLNFQDDQGQTPICIAIIAGQTEIVKKLIEKNAQLDTKNIYGNNTLHIASTSGKDSEIINVLFGADVSIGTHIEDGQEYLNCQNKEGKTPLHIASEYNKGEAIRLLLWAGADSQLKSTSGEKALHLAAKNFSAGAIIALNREFIKGKDISSIEDYKVALETIKSYRPNSSSPNWNNYQSSLGILRSVVAQYKEQEENKLKSTSLKVTIECSGHNEELQTGSALPDEKEIANDGLHEAGSQYESPSTSPSNLEGTPVQHSLHKLQH
jgi:ankyrin repeat protein